MEPVRIAQGLAEEHREQAAALYLQAFRPLLRRFLGEGPRARDLLARSMNPGYAIVATCGGQLAGLAGYQDRDGNLFDVRWREMARSYGLVSGSVRLVAMGLLLSRKQRPGSLLMDGIAVAPEMRGQGIGTRLLAAVCEHARAGGYNAVRLDVLDNNPRARALYERKGFVPLRHEALPLLKPLFGFSGVTEMRKTV